MKKLLVCVLFLGVVFPVLAETITIYHTSDTHGFFYPKNGQGGAAALAAVLKSGPKEYLLLDGGDFAEGTVETQRSNGLKAVQLMNQLGYQAAAVGNHEFAFQDEGFDDILSAAQFDVLAANLVSAQDGTLPKNILPYRIYRLGGLKVAVIGVANRNPTKKSQKYRFTKPLPALEKTLEDVERQKPDLVVVLAHDSLADDRPGSPNYIGDIGRRFGGRVHLVLGGHAHKIFQNEFRGGILFAESGCHFQHVTKITVQTDDKTGRIQSLRSELIPLEIVHTGEDKAIQVFAQSLRETDVDEAVGKTSAAFSKKSFIPGHMDAPVDNWVADATCRYAPSDVCIHNVGGARVGLPKGAVSRREIMDLYPFDNTVVMASVSGAFLKKLITGGLFPWNRLAYSGLMLSYKKTKKGKIKNLKIWVRGERLQEDKQYTVALNSYIAGGGSEGKLFKTLPPGSLRPIGEKTMRQILEEDFKQGVLIPPETGRILER